MPLQAPGGISAIITGDPQDGFTIFELLRISSACRRGTWHVPNLLEEMV
jgi:hypothetical protein